MHRVPIVLLGGAVALAALLSPRAGQDSGFASSDARPAPEFPSRETASWVGLPPGAPAPTIASMRGQVVLMNLWTFG